MIQWTTLRLRPRFVLSPDRVRLCHLNNGACRRTVVCLSDHPSRCPNLQAVGTVILLRPGGHSKRPAADGFSLVTFYDTYGDYGGGIFKPPPQDLECHCLLLLIIISWSILWFVCYMNYRCSIYLYNISIMCSIYTLSVLITRHCNFTTRSWICSCCWCCRLNWHCTRILVCSARFRVTRLANVWLQALMYTRTLSSPTCSVIAIYSPITCTVVVSRWDLMGCWHGLLLYYV